MFNNFTLQLFVSLSFFIYFCFHYFQHIIFYFRNFCVVKYLVHIFCKAGMHNFVVSQNNAISVHKIVLHSLVPIFYIYFDHTNFFIFINSYYLNLHLYFGNIFLNILVPQVRCSPRMVQVACGGTTPVVVQKGGSQLSATIEK